MTVIPATLRRNRRATAIVAILLILAIAFVAWRHLDAAPAVQYSTAAVSRGVVARTVTGSGTVNPVTTVQVGTYVSGVIQELLCDYNTHVVKGQLCARIDPRPYQTVVDQDQANVATARAQLEKDQANRQYAQTTYERNLELGRRGIVPQDTVDVSKSTSDQSNAQLQLDRTTIEQREAELKAAEINLGYTNIVSPVNGTVVARNITTGQTVAASFQTPTLFLIATDLANMEVDANISESDIGGVTVGDDVSFTVEAFPDQVFHGKVTQVRQAPQSVQNVITYDVVISAPNPKLLLMPGMTATTRIIVDRRDDVVRVPNQALRYRPDGLTAASAATNTTQNAKEDRQARAGEVWVLRDGRPAKVPVTLGLDDDTYAEVSSPDLNPGDRVILGEQSNSHQPSAAETRPPAFRF